MNFQTLLALGCFAGTVIQSAADIAAWRDRLKLAQKDEALSKLHPPAWILICWFLGVASTAALGGLLLAYHPQPEIKTVTQIVEKPVPVPCPATKTGPAKARGGIAIGHSGNGDTYNVGQPSQKPQ